MGWLLTLMLSLPQVSDPIEVQMWFSRERYCTFAQEKFAEHPLRQRLPDGTTVLGAVKDSHCRELEDHETALIPEHMRSEVLDPWWKLGSGEPRN